MLFSIQYLRAAAAISVLIHHASWKAEQYSTNPLDWFHIGYGGVDLFFIISGYIMCHTTKNLSVRPAGFLEARVMRVFPLYWLLTTVALLVYLVFPDKVNSSGGDTDIFGSYSLIPGDGKYLIQNGWSLSYELYFYLVFSIGLFFSDFRRHFLPVLIMGMAVVAGMLWSFDDVYFRFLSSPLLVEFLLGIAAFYFCEKVGMSTQLAWATVVIAVLSLVAVNFGFSSNVRVVDLGLPSFMLFVGFVSLEPRLRLKEGSILSRLGRELGDSSYSLYLIHPFSLVAGAIALRSLGLSSHPVAFLCLLVIASVVAGVMCYEYVERPLTRVVKRISTRASRRSAQSPAGVSAT